MAQRRGEQFGSDLSLVDYTDGLDLTRRSDVPVGGDLALVSGNDNIIQALTLRLRVREGELALLGWPSYGSRLHELVGEPNVTRTHLKLQAFARQAVEADPRVAEVADVQTQTIPGERDTVRVLLAVSLIEQPSPLNLVFEFGLGAR